MNELSTHAAQFLAQHLRAQGLQATATGSVVTTGLGRSKILCQALIPPGSHPLVVQVNLGITDVPGADDTLWDALAGIGGPQSAAVEDAVKKWLASTFSPVASFLGHKSAEQRNTFRCLDVPGNVNEPPVHWACLLGPVVAWTLPGGSPFPGTSLHEHFKPDLFIGLERRLHAFSLFISVGAEQPLTVECRLDNQSWEPGNRRLRMKLSNLKTTPAFSSQRQFFLLIPPDDKSIPLHPHIQTAAEILAQNAQLDDDGIMRLLTERGLEKKLAIDLYLFLPTAFTRAMFEGRGPTFQPTYRVVDPKSGKRDAHRYDANPVYVEARRVARHWLADPERRQQCLNIAGRSAELDALNNLLHKGSKLENIRFVESQIPAYESDYLRSQPPEVEHRKRPWWKLW